MTFSDIANRPSLIIIEFIRSLCVASGVTTAYQDEIPSLLETNVCHVKSLGESIETRTLCQTAYSDQLFQVFYRGNDDRGDSLKQSDLIYKEVRDQYNVSLANTTIISMVASRPKFAFTDENQNAHYSIAVTVQYA